MRPGTFVIRVRKNGRCSEKCDLFRRIDGCDNHWHVNKTNWAGNTYQYPTDECPKSGVFEISIKKLCNL